MTMKGGLLLRITTTTKTLSKEAIPSASTHITQSRALVYTRNMQHTRAEVSVVPVSYTHLRAHETREDLVCRLLLEKKKQR